jgi:hypothetical protein
VSWLPDDARDGGAPSERMITGVPPEIESTERSRMATKDKNTKKSMEKKRPQKTLKEKRQARKDKK